MHRCHVQLSLSALLIGIGVAQRAHGDEPPTEVVVQTDPLDRRSTRDATAHATVLRRSDLEQPGATAASVLARAPGAQVQRTGASTELSTVSLRGATSAQLPVYWGPVLLNDELTGTADLSLLPLFFIDRIELYRGHAPSYADRLGLSGAVVVEPRLPKRTEAFVGATVGSYGASSLLAGAAAGDERASNLIGVERSTAANDYAYADNRGTVMDATDDRRVLRRNADADTLALWNTGQYRLTRSVRVRWLLHGLERHQGLPGLSLIPALHARGTTLRELGAVTTTMSCRAARPNDDCHIELQTQWQHSGFRLADPYLELGYGTTGVRINSDRVSERLRITHMVSARLAFTWLVGTDAATLDLARNTASGLKSTRRSALLGTNASWTLNSAVDVVALARFSAESTAAGNTSSEWQRLSSGRIGIRYRLVDGFTLSGNVGSYGRTPTLAELYGTSPNLRGNAELRPERGISEDVGLSWQWAFGAFRGNAEVVAYHQHCSELVAWQRTSFGQVSPYNVGQSRLMGAELSVGAAWRQWLRLEGALGLLDPRDTTPDRTQSNDILPYRSRFSGNLRLNGTLPGFVQVPGIRTAGAAVTLWHRSSRYSAPAGNAVLPGSTAADVDGRVTLNAVPVTLRASVMNLFDRQNYDILGMPLPGRCLFAGVDLHLEFE